MAPERKSDAGARGSAKKRKVITLEEKVGIIEKYEGGQTLSSIARGLGMAVSTVNTIVRDRDRIREHVKGSPPMRSTVITKQRTGVIAEMEKLLTLWLQDNKQRRIPLSHGEITAKATSLYEDLKAKRGETKGTFVASHGWFTRFKNRANLHNIKVYGNGRKKFKSTEKYEQKINAPVSSSVFPPMAETCQDLGTLSQSWDKDFATKSLQYDVRIQPVKKVCHGLDNPLTQQMLEASKQHMLGKGEEAQGISQQLTKGSSISVGSAMGEMERISEVETIPLPSELRPIDPVHYANVPLARVSVEIFSLPEVDGYQHLLVLVDYHTKWPEAEALKEKDPLCVAAFLFRQFCQHGGFAINMKEEDEEFVARVYNELHRLTGVAQQVMRNYHSVCNMCRRDCENCCIKKAFVDVLKKYADWPKWIYPVLFALRTTKQEGTGQSPFQLLYNRSPVLWGCSTLTL